MALFEAKLIEYLHTATGLHVSNEKSGDRLPERYILIQRTQGSEVEQIEGATYAIQSISSKSKLEAAEINEDVKEAMRAFPAESYVSSCRLNSDYDFTDPKTKEYRYQAVYNIVYF